MDKKQISLIGSCCTAILGIIAVLLPLAPFVSGTLAVLGQSQTETIDGFSFIFGDYSNGGSLTAWILILAGSVLAVCAFLAYLLKKEKLGGLALLLAGLLILVGGILYFFFVQFAGLSSADIGGLVGYSFNLAFGAIIGGIIGVVGGLLGLGLGVREILSK